MGNGQIAALERWRSRAVHDVTLPSGTRAQVRVPSAEKLATDTRVPSHLRMRALQFTTSIIRTNELDEAGLTEMLELQANLTAMTLVGIWDDDSCEQNAKPGHFDALSLDPAEVHALELPSEDLDALEAIALRRLTPNQVTASSRLQLGLVPPDEASRVQREEAAGTVDAYGPFRVVPGGADSGSDGTAVRHPAEPDDRDYGSSGGVGG